MKLRYCTIICLSVTLVEGKRWGEGGGLLELSHTFLGGSCKLFGNEV